MLADPDLAHTTWDAPDAVFAGLAGSWSLERTLSTGASMTGEAVFIRRDDGSLAYRENGRLRLAGGQVFDAERRYIYRAATDGFSVWFDEQPERLFHVIALHESQSALHGGAPHPCRDDIYQSTYEFHGDGSFIVVHDVSGPTKNYRSRTLFRR